MHLLDAGGLLRGHENERIGQTRQVPAIAAAQILASGEQDVAEALTKYLSANRKSPQFNLNLTENAE